MLLDTTIAIATPERVRFRHRIAGPGRRAAAWAVDALIQGTVLLLALLASAVFGMVGLEGVGMGGFLVVVFVVQWTYGAVLETLGAGRTPGKWALRLRVVTTSGAPARPGQYLLRNLLKGADFLPVAYGVGVVVMALDARFRRIGDLVAGTVVVDERPGPAFGTAPIRPPITDEERQALPARVEMTREEIRAVEELLRRRAKLSDERTEQLAEQLATPIADLTGIRAATSERTLVLAYARATGRDRALDATGGDDDAVIVAPGGSSAKVRSGGISGISDQTGGKRTGRGHPDDGAAP